MTTHINNWGIQCKNQSSSIQVSVYDSEKTFYTKTVHDFSANLTCAGAFWTIFTFDGQKCAIMLRQFVSYTTSSIRIDLFLELILKII